MTAPARVQQLIGELNLAPHPEGGYYRRVYRSDRTVTMPPTGESRAAMTTIYYLLCRGQVSRWHAIDTDEVWHFYEGDPLQLLIADPRTRVAQQHRLGPYDSGQNPVCVVPAGWWQAARPIGEYAFVGCAVAPGFEFSRFKLLADVADVSVPLAEHADLL